jgi:hypothetical protein
MAKHCNCGLVKERLELAILRTKLLREKIDLYTSVLKFIVAIVGVGVTVYPLINMAFNYLLTWITCCERTKMATEV